MLSQEIIFNKVTFHDVDQIMRYRIVVLNEDNRDFHLSPIKLCKIGHTSFQFCKIRAI